MEVFLFFLHTISVFFLLHTYWIYPKIMHWLARGKSLAVNIDLPKANMPVVSVLMSIYNEEKVIAEKMETLLQQTYPQHHLLFFIGSDCSSDQTNSILSAYKNKDERIHFFPYKDRSGKPGVINRLYKEAIQQRPPSPQHLLLITDANVMLEKNCLTNLSRHFQDDQIIIVDAHMKHIGKKGDGISYSEDKYLSGEVKLKHHEGLVGGNMIGPFGGCYVLRSDFFSPVPTNFLVDDFYIAMRVFEKGGKAVNDLEAVCYEAVSHDWREEFRRKARISTGNYQNLLTFRHLWWPPFNALNFAFFSHKVLRWLGPFFLLIIWLSSLGLCTLFNNKWYTGLFLSWNVFYFALPALDMVLKKLHIQWHFVRNIRYFLLMNVALLIGFFRYIKGVKNNVWEPPKRPQIPA